MKKNLAHLLAFGLIGATGFIGVTGGCGGPAPKPIPRLNLVSGSIVFADKKVELELANNAVVQFHPKSGESNGKKIWGSINDGSFFISTDEGGKLISGAPEGDFIVTIAPPSPPSNDPKNGPPSPPSEKVIPRKYRDPKTTDLTMHVNKGDNKMPVIELKP